MRSLADLEVRVNHYIETYEQTMDDMILESPMPTSRVVKEKCKIFNYRN